MTLADIFGQVLIQITLQSIVIPGTPPDYVLKTYIRFQHLTWTLPMPKQAVFTLKLESELRDQFMAEAAHRPASQIVREMMRQFVQPQRETREYQAFLQRKVEAARTSVEAGNGISNDEIEARFAARRARAATDT